MKTEKEIDVLDEVYKPRPQPPALMTEEEHARQLLEKRCEFADDWEVVVCIDRETNTGHAMMRENLSDLLFANNYLVGYEENGRGDFTAFNPIFLRAAECYGVKAIIMTKLASEGENYEIVFPNAYSPLCFSRPT